MAKRSTDDLPPDSEPVFDGGDEPVPFDQRDTLPADDENNILPGNDPLDEDPNDNGADEQNDPDDLRRRPKAEQP